MTNSSIPTCIFLGIVLLIIWLCVLSPMRDSYTRLPYLTTYEQQDFYRNNPQVYPVPHTYTTAKYEFDRGAIQKDIAEHGQYSGPGYIIA